ncbi:aldo/keto reductase [Haloferax marisrubri]|uniref:NADP-dependent oxidoreductase domain-containing protein n=1 Tax=Haloferax marisrubri TaxID=1544719 RepID=A0A2P4NME5_9EURY|nr:aldo/keto reductase [Haloferax marisrubri]POG54271.1 hypothetical protein AUR65_016655 [Haloferax marisrubri]
MSVATKVRPSNLSYDRVLENTKESLAALGIETVDLLSVHYPLKACDVEETMVASTELYERVLIDYVGLNNYSVPMPDKAMDASRVRPSGRDASALAATTLPRTRPVTRLLAGHVSAYRRGRRDDGADARRYLREVRRDADAVSLAWLSSKDRIAAIPKATGDHVAEK